MASIKSMYYDATSNLENYGKDVPLLGLRLILAYGFWEPAIKKWKSMENTIMWFGESLGLPVPTLMAYMAATTEILGVFLLILGLGTRIISIPLIITMLVAIFAVHLGNGWASSENGVEIPVMYIAMLLILFTLGSGRLSLDHLIKNFVNKKN